MSTPKKEGPKTVIEHNTFIGVQWDAKAVDAVLAIAEGLKINAEGLGKLAEVLKSSNVHIGCMLKIADGGDK